MSGAAGTIDRAALRRWRLGLALAFLVGGVTVASWGPRLPDLTEQLRVTTGQVGTVFALGTIGGLVGLLGSGPTSRRLGARTGLLVAVLIIAGSVAGVAAGVALNVLWLIAVAMVVNGLGVGLMDVLINVQSAAAERALGRTIMPQLHGAWSVGVAVGSGIGAGCTALRIAPAAQFAGEAVLVAVAAAISARSVPAAFADAAPRPTQPLGDRFRVLLTGWADRRLMLIGLVMLGVDFAELSSNNWLTLGVQRGHGQTPAVAALFFTVFAISEACARLLGGPVVDRLGRVRTVRLTAALCIAGLLLFILADSAVPVLVGVVLWAVGVSMGFPLGMSAAAEGEGDGADRVGIVASIGYFAGLAGPTVIGFLTQGVGLLSSFWVVVVFVAAAFAASGALRPVGTT